MFWSGCSMTFLARVSSESCGGEAGGDHEDEGDDDERERRTPGAALRAWVRRRRVCEDLGGYRGVGAAEDVRVRCGHGEDGEQQRRRLTRGPGDGEQGAADDAADRRRQHDGYG